jgi:hypothetical protein
MALVPLQDFTSNLAMMRPTKMALENWRTSVDFPGKTNTILVHPTLPFAYKLYDLDYDQKT